MRFSLKAFVRWTLYAFLTVLVVISIRDQSFLNFMRHANATQKFQNIKHGRRGALLLTAGPRVLMIKDAGRGRNLTVLHRSPRDAKSIRTRSVTKGRGVLSARRRATRLDDIVISLKTTSKNHQGRVKLLLSTWIQFAKNQTYIFTDEEDPWLSQQLPERHVINTKCPRDHGRKSLCCKMSLEFDHFVTSGRRWFCHVDDDTYLNVERLVQLLAGYNHTDDLYLGKPSLDHPIEIMDRAHPGQRLAFWFATGGAGFCISRGLALKMVPYAGGGRLMHVGEQIRLPDDCTIGYIIDYVLHKELTVVPEFHSHLEALWHINHLEFKNQITFSYDIHRQKPNVVNIPGWFSMEKDPTRLWSIHCHLHPYIRDCLKDR